MQGPREVSDTPGHRAPVGSDKGEPRLAACCVCEKERSGTRVDGRLEGRRLGLGHELGDSGLSR